MCSRLFQASVAPPFALPINQDERPVSALQASVMSLRQRWAQLPIVINYLYFVVCRLHYLKEERSLCHLITLG